MIKAELFYEKYLNIGSPYEHQIKMWELIRDVKYPLLLRAPTVLEKLKL